MDLSPFDFVYDPFADLDAAADPHLTEYLLIPQTALIAQKEMPAIIFAPPGGGKTSIRLYTEQSQLDISGRTFTITYLPDLERGIPEQSDGQEHLKQIKEAAARDILFRLISNPDQYVDMPLDHQAWLTALLEIYLCIDLNTILSILYEADPEIVISLLTIGLGRLPPRYRQAQADQYVQLAEALQASRNSPLAALRLQVENLDFIELCRLVMNAFQAHEVFLLLDGLDASSESKRHLDRTARWAMPLFASAQQWERERVYLKAFLTTEIASSLSHQFERMEVDLPTVTIQWDDVLLAEVIRLRVSAASQARFASLDGISALDLRETELQIARCLPPVYKLPREMISIVDQTLSQSLERRQAGEPAQIQRQDIQAALNWYQRLPNRAFRQPISF